MNAHVFGNVDCAACGHPKRWHFRSTFQCHELDCRCPGFTNVTLSAAVRR